VPIYTAHIGTLFDAATAEVGEALDRRSAKSIGIGTEHLLRDTEYEATQRTA